MDYTTLGSIELRELAYDKWPGCSGQIRKLNKEQLAQVLQEGWELDFAIKYFKHNEGVTESPTPVTPVSAPKLNEEEALGQMLARLVGDHIKTPTIDKESIKAEILAEAEKVINKLASEVRVINLEIHKGEMKIPVGAAHYKFETLLTILEQRINTMMVGPAGSGKTTAAEKAAEALGLEFGAISVGPQTSKVDFLGYMDANGKYVSTNFRKAYETGGVFIIDEIDAGNAGVMTIINAATSNGVVGFPDGMIPRHRDFICVAAANTFGRGADRQYVGRQQMDAATLNRFVVLEWDYDEVLEIHLSGDEKWARQVQKYRKACETLKIRHVISPRASINGAKLLNAGLPKDEVINMVVWQGLDQASVTKIEQGAR